MRDFFPTGDSARRSGGSQGENQGAAGAQRKDTKRCEGAAGIESHGIDQKPERQESARIESVRVGPCPFCFLRLVTRPLCRYSSFLPFPSGLRDLPRRPGHEPEHTVRFGHISPTHTAAFAPQRV
nr:MAG TPA: restriction alleviation protein [Bacteriophage sp.]